MNHTRTVSQNTSTYINYMRDNKQPRDDADLAKVMFSDIFLTKI